MATAVDTDAFEALRRLIAQRSGIVVPATKAGSLRAKLERHAAGLGFQSLEAYLGHLSAAGARDPLWQEVFHRVTTGETYFYRNTAQMKAFSEHVLPETMHRQEGRMFRRLKVWSAGCASGEEAYTLAILALEALGDEAAAWQPQVLATDIDEPAIRQARAGRYNSQSVSRLPAPLVRRHLRPDGDGWIVGPKARALVNFQVINFADTAAMAAQTHMDVVFCRNVLIYFDRDFRKRVAAHLFESLKPGGYLVIGHAESLRGIHGGFETVRCPGTVLYRRPEA